LNIKVREDRPFISKAALEILLNFSHQQAPGYQPINPHLSDHNKTVPILLYIDPLSRSSCMYMRQLKREIGSSLPILKFTFGQF
jgi:hypothetical protein